MYFFGDIIYFWYIFKLWCIVKIKGNICCLLCNLYIIHVVFVIMLILMKSIHVLHQQHFQTFCLIFFTNLEIKDLLSIHYFFVCEKNVEYQVIIKTIVNEYLKKISICTSLGVPNDNVPLLILIETSTAIGLIHALLQGYQCCSLSINGFLRYQY